MWFALIAAVVLVGLFYYYFFKSDNDYWKKYGIRQIDPSVAVSKIDIFFGKKGIADGDEYIYEEIGNEKFCGVFEMGKPMLLIKDLDLMKKILIKDFDHFVDRRPFFTDNDSGLKRMLPTLEGDEWKGVRTSVSPTFTTGKIRRMMDYFNSVGQEWVNELKSKAKQNGTGSVKVDLLNTVNQYTVDVIASAVFGMNAGTIKNPDSAFSQMATRLSEMSKKQIIKFSMSLMFPRLWSFLKIKLLDQEAETFFDQILGQGLKARMKGEGGKRNDFLQLLVDAKKGELKAVGSDELNAFEKEAQLGTGGLPEKKQFLTEEIMNAQSLVFFFAGFSTTSNFITFAAYILAAHQDVQEKLRQEVAKIVKPDGSYDYDELGQLTYLDMVISEVLRKYPVGARLERICTKDYKDPESGLFVPKGTVIAIPVNCIHHDKRYYENADKFYPEHFTPDKKSERNPYVYMPFGIGPRNCIGMQFALIESKAAIAHLVHNFVIEPTEKTPLPVRGRPFGFQLVPPKDLEVKFTPVSK